ncbi:MAG: hypothetical protein GQ534_10155 [Candidatus Delongbacteria bacterium]|nr:hypothetical protein [Candidatus Delongbacteria bacterium]
MKRLFVLLVVLSMFFGCSQQPTASNSNEVLPSSENVLLDAVNDLGTANQRFAFNIYKEIINASETSENIVMSPLSISIVLSMLSNGADGNTKVQIKSALELSNLTDKEINSGFLEFINSTNSPDQSITLELANSIWTDDDFIPKEEFININKEYYEAEVQSLDFSLETTLGIINGWVEKVTHGKITDLISEILPDEVMYLINAVYFKGNWKYPFDENETANKWFYPEVGERFGAITMWSAGRDFTYIYETDFIAARLPYCAYEMPASELGTKDSYMMGNNHKIAMYIFVPQGEMLLKDFVNGITQESWNLWLDSFLPIQEIMPYYYDTFKFEMPKFKIDFAIKLNAVLKSLGMVDAFLPSADLSGITDIGGLFINIVKQKAFIDVNEKGSEAAAATYVGATFGADPEFYANRPFLYIIRDDRSGNILFMGQVYNPEYE